MGSPTNNVPDEFKAMVQAAIAEAQKRRADAEASGELKDIDKIIEEVYRKLMEKIQLTGITDEEFIASHQAQVAGGMGRVIGWAMGLSKQFPPTHRKGMGESGVEIFSLDPVIFPFLGGEPYMGFGGGSHPPPPPPHTLPPPLPPPEGPAVPMSHYENYFFSVIGMKPGDSAWNYRAVLNAARASGALPMAPGPGIRPTGLTQQINSAGIPRGRVFLPTERPDAYGLYLRAVDVVDPRTLKWMWLPR